MIIPFLMYFTTPRPSRRRNTSLYPLCHLKDVLELLTQPISFPIAADRCFLWVIATLGLMIRQDRWHKVRLSWENDRMNASAAIQLCSTVDVQNNLAITFSPTGRQT
jgi:hypothetical protein